MARYLAQSNADVEAPNANSSSPLFIACLKGHLPMVELLVNDLHVDCEQSNSNGVKSDIHRIYIHPASHYVAFLRVCCLLIIARGCLAAQELHLFMSAAKRVTWKSFGF